MSVVSIVITSIVICFFSSCVAKKIFATMALKFMCRFSLVLLFGITFAVDKNNFKTCEQSSFCRRLRNAKPEDLTYALNLDSLQVTDTSVDIELKNLKAGALFKLKLTSVNGNIFRVFINELNPIKPRYQVEGVLNGEPQPAKLEVLERDRDRVTIRSGNNKAVLNATPFKIQFYTGDALVAVINQKGLFDIEHLREKPQETEGGENNEVKEDPGAWEENFKSHHDSKPRGPEALGVDVSFPGAQRIYGLPEHADKLALKTTGPGGVEPYRLYNLDVFEYEMDSTMALYGAVPVVYAHSSKFTVGVFWNNAAETWVDITNSKDANVVSSIVNLVSGNKRDDSVDAHFMSESGVFDLFVLMGPTPKSAITQYASLTGVAPLPQLFTLGYHQCRWNYNDEDDVVNVIDNFDAYDMPVDVIWLDIEYTDGKKYFTWDSVRFAHPSEMVANLTSTGRKLVVIIDPHVKRESGYFLHEDALSNNLYVKNKDGNVYEGWCWPGSSSYPDFLEPRVRDYYKGLYSLEHFKGTTKDVQIWNDMNEPSVFNGPEVTMPKDCLHYGGWEHRHIHNIYGMLYTQVTYEGLLARSSDRRPFILTRAHFAGSQRYAAVWTGDNAAEWSHLVASLPMCLSEAIAGISFCGADIGGFFGNPDVELLQRWYQTGVWLPFYRAHAHIDTRRREPYLFDEEARRRIRGALKLRYALLPLYYTLFWEHELRAEPVIRPLWYHWPVDETTLDIDNEIMIGDSILARPVTEAGASSVTVYLPGGGDQTWFDIEDWKLYKGGVVSIPVSLDKNPAFYRGGKIIARKDRPRRSSSVSHNDPYTLYVVLNTNGAASGTLYVDDGESYNYRNKNYLYLNFEFKDNTLSSSLIDKTDFITEAWIERVVILGAPEKISSAKIESKSLDNVVLETSYDGEGRALVIRKPGVNIRETFIIKLN